VAARERPILDAVNIPLAELEDRLHELPPRPARVLVADTGVDAASAVAWLCAGGRSAEAAPCSFAAAPEPGRLWQPNAWLEELLPRLEPGFAVDLGCGSGREAVALAAAGWRVSAIDRLDDALDKARDLERRTLGEPRIEWVCRDLESGDFALAPVVDLLTSFAYLHRPLLEAAPFWLAPGGSLVVETFTSIHRERHGKPRNERFVLAPGELATLAGELKVLHHSEGWREDGRHTARLWAHKE